MGWKFYNINTLPDPGDIVWCKWPQRENRGGPGPVVRATLVREAMVHDDSETGTRFGSVMVSYGTGEFTDAQCLVDLVITDKARAKELGLHKPTRFALDAGNKKNLFWCEEYFVAQGYIRGQGIVAGRLGDEEIRRMRACLALRGYAAK